MKETEGRIQKKHINGVRWQVRDSFVESPAFHSLSSLDKNWLPGYSDKRTRSRSRWSTVYSSQGKDVFLKYYLPRSLFESLKYLFRPSRASAEWRNAGSLKRLGIPVPALLAWGERRTLGWWSQSFLVTESLVDSPTLLEWSESQRVDARSGDLRRAIAGHVALMHQHGLFHRDLHGGNVLVVESDTGLAPCFLDFHEMLRLPWSVNRFGIDDLARLNGFVEASTYQRIRFVYDYLAARDMDGSLARDWVRRIDRTTRNLWDYYETRGKQYRRY